MLQLGLVSGAGVRGLMGMREMLQDQHVSLPRSTTLPQQVTVFGPRKKPTTPGTLPMQKLAMPPLVAPIAGAIGAAGAKFGPAIKDVSERIAAGAADMLPTPNTTNPIANEWGIPAAFAALAGGSYGGYKLTDWLLRKERDMAGKQSVQDAEDDYRKALSEQYRAAMLAKRGSAGDDGDDFGLNDLAELYASVSREKQAFGMSALGALWPTLDQAYAHAWSPIGVPGLGTGHDSWEAAKGISNAAMLAAALGSGKVTYDWAKGRNKQEMLQQALKRRQALRSRVSPPPMLARPGELSDSEEGTPIAA